MPNSPIVNAILLRCGGDAAKRVMLPAKGVFHVCTAWPRDSLFRLHGSCGCVDLFVVGVFGAAPCVTHHGL